MELRILKSTVIAALTIGGACPALAQSIPTPGGEIVLTDPLVRAIQIGPPPVGLVTAYNPTAGVGLVALPGIGVRRARLIGVPVSWAGRRLVAATDLDTGVEFTAVLPTPPQLAAAKVVKSAGDAILVRWQSANGRVTEAVPVGSVFVATNGGLAPATRVKGALQPGSTVLIPQDSRSRAIVVVPKAK